MPRQTSVRVVGLSTCAWRGLRPQLARGVAVISVTRTRTYDSSHLFLILFVCVCIIEIADELSEWKRHHRRAFQESSRHTLAYHHRIRITRNAHGFVSDCRFLGSGRAYGVGVVDSVGLMVRLRRGRIWIGRCGDVGIGVALMRRVISGHINLWWVRSAEGRRICRGEKIRAMNRI